MNRILEKRYNLLLSNLTKCEKCKLQGKNKKKGCDHTFKPEPANIGKNYGKNIKILIIGHMPRKSKSKHSCNYYLSINKYKTDSDKEEPIENWNISYKIRKYLFKILRKDSLSYIAFTNIVKCQRENKGSGTNKRPLSFMYKNCFKYLRKEIDILNPQIIILSGYWYPLFYQFLDVNAPGNYNSIKEIFLNKNKYLILNSNHLSNWKISNSQISKNSTKLLKLLKK